MARGYESDMGDDGRSWAGRPWNAEEKIYHLWHDTISKAYREGKHEQCIEAGLDLLLESRLPTGTRIEILHLLSTMMGAASGRAMLMEAREILRSRYADDFACDMLLAENHNMMKGLEKNGMVTPYGATDKSLRNFFGLVDDGDPLFQRVLEGTGEFESLCCMRQLQYDAFDMLEYRKIECVLPLQVRRLYDDDRLDILELDGIYHFCFLPAITKEDIQAIKSQGSAAVIQACSSFQEHNDCCVIAAPSHTSHLTAKVAALVMKALRNILQRVPVSLSRLSRRLRSILLFHAIRAANERNDHACKIAFDIERTHVSTGGGSRVPNVSDDTALCFRTEYAGSEDIEILIELSCMPNYAIVPNPQPIFLFSCPDFENVAWLGKAKKARRICEILCFVATKVHPLSGIKDREQLQWILANIGTMYNVHILTRDPTTQDIGNGSHVDNLPLARVAGHWDALRLEATEYAAGLIPDLPAIPVASEAVARRVLERLNASYFRAQDIFSAWAEAASMAEVFTEDELDADGEVMGPSCGCMGSERYGEYHRCLSCGGLALHVNFTGNSTGAHE